jgi:hypothetical protein
MLETTIAVQELTGIEELARRLAAQDGSNPRSGGADGLG